MEIDRSKQPIKLGRRDTLKLGGLVVAGILAPNEPFRNPFHIPTLLPSEQGILKSPGIDREMAETNLLSTGMYSKNHFTYRVIQQPGYNYGFVSEEKEELTQFRLSAEYGNIGILAHNYLAGKKFFDFEMGDIIYVFFGTDKIEKFKVSERLMYQSLNPYDPYSELRDIETGIVDSAENVFRRVYMGHHLTLQTCIDGNGIDRPGQESWGRIFIIALPTDTIRRP